MDKMFWQIDPMSSTRVGFAGAWKLDAVKDLSMMTRDLPEGVAIFSPKACAGRIHLKGVLLQAIESSKRGVTLARNGAIDLLMRLTCQTQIKDAVEVSEISSTSIVGAFGHISGEVELEPTIRNVEKALGNSCKRDDRLLELDSPRMLYLRRLHSIPQSLPDSQVVDFLLEKSALLCFSK